MINKIVCYENNRNLLLYTDKWLQHARIDKKYGVKGASWLEKLVKDATSIDWLADIMEVKHLWERQRNILPISKDVIILDELPTPYDIWE